MLRKVVFFLDFHASKSGVPAMVPWVWIPPCPPFLYEKLLKYGSFSYFYRQLPLARRRIAALQSGGFATFLGICVFRRRKMVEISCPGRPLVVKVCGNEPGLALSGDVQMGVNIRRCAEGWVPQPDLNLLHSCLHIHIESGENRYDFFYESSASVEKMS